MTVGVTRVKKRQSMTVDLYDSEFGEGRFYTTCDDLEDAIQTVKDLGAWEDSWTFWIMLENGTEMDFEGKVI